MEYINQIWGQHDFFSSAYHMEYINQIWGQLPNDSFHNFELIAFDVRRTQP